MEEVGWVGGWVDGWDVPVKGRKLQRCHLVLHSTMVGVGGWLGRLAMITCLLFCVGGWVGGWVEEKEAVGMSYCMLKVGGWVRWIEKKKAV